MANCLALICLLLLPLLVRAGSIPEGYRRVAARYQIPAELLYAVALTESGTRTGSVVRPWPWTLNVSGTSHRYRHRRAACHALESYLRHTDAKHIDVGLGQINLGWHPKLFARPCDALSPWRNLAVTAQLLRQHYDAQPGSWLSAAGSYHHPAGGVKTQRYQLAVSRHLQILTGG